MEVREAIEARRAIQHFDPDHAISAAERTELLRLARLAPTSFNIQHCRFVVVTDRELRRQLRAASFDQSQVTDASLLVVLCADLAAWNRRPERYWDHVPPPLRDRFVALIRGVYGDQEQLQRDEAIRSCGLAAQTLMLAGQGMGYDSCALVGFDFDAVARLIALPDDHLIGMFVVLGKALRPAHARGGRLPETELVFENRFPDVSGLTSP
jgi:nitroreductase